MPIYLGATLISGGGGGDTIIEGTGLVPVATIAALRAVAGPVDGQIVYVRSHSTSTDVAPEFSTRPCV